jgi:putative RecB family exonuclease
MEFEPELTLHGADDEALNDPAFGGPAADYADATDRDLEPPLCAPGSRPAHLSPSSASLFQQCSRRWRFRYVERLADPPGEPALVGTFAHRVLELLLGLAPSQRTVDRAKALAREVWPEMSANTEFQALGLDESASRAFRWRSWLAIQGLWAVEDPQAVLVEATEQDIKVELGGVPFRGIIDRLDVADDGVVVTDYKSGKAPRRRFADSRLAQVLLYAAAVEAQTGQRPVRARLVYLGQGTLSTPVTEDNLAETVAALRSTWDTLVEALDTDRFDPSPGPLCAWCPFVGHCPEGQAELGRRLRAGTVRFDAPGLSALPAAG